MNIITFDSSLKRSAWARFCHGAVSWEARSFINLHKDNPDLRFEVWRQWAASAIDSCNPTLVVYEMPTVCGGGDRGGKAQVMLEMTLKVLCAQRGIPVKVIYPTTLKCYITGDGKADKSAMRKAIALRVAGYEPEQDDGGDVADALGALIWAQDGCPPSKSELARQAKKAKKAKAR